MTDTTVPVSSEQLAVARELLALFPLRLRSHLRGSVEQREVARIGLADAIASTAADQADHLHDAIGEAHYYLGMVCLECHGLIPDDVDSTDYCSRACYEEGGL
jgi:hypothetical protein